MSTALIERLTRQFNYPLLTADNFDLFVYANETSVLFFSGNVVQHPESHDVAIILPELVAAFKQRLTAAVIDASIERELQLRYHFTSWPSLVFLKRGQYLGALSGILDWSEYLQQTAAILNASPGQPPAFDIEQACSALQ